MRAFIVGNGPSLNQTPLDALKDEVCFGVNRIHLLYDKVVWRPNHWVCVDRSRALPYSLVDDIMLHLDLGEDCYVREDFARWMPDTSGYSNLTWTVNCDHDSATANPAESWHLPELCKFAGCVPMAIQLAFLKGYNPIYLVGCDGGYTDDETKNHFVSDYCRLDCRTVQQAIVDNETLRMGHALAQRECKARGIEVFNATVGKTVIKGWPYVDLEDVIND